MLEDRSATFPISDLGAFALAPFTPGRFAAAVQRTAMQTHGLQVARDDMTSSFILDLRHNGSATLCRGWRYLSSNDGPEVHSIEHIREQLGYSGTWVERDGWIQLDLHFDDDYCPRIGEYTNLVPEHDSDWHLQCLPLSPPTDLGLVGAILACRLHWSEPRFGEDQPHTISGLLPGNWIILGGGKGLRIRRDAPYTTASADEDAPMIWNSSDPVLPNSWQQSF